VCPASESKAANENGRDGYFQQMNAQHVESSKYERALRPWLAAAIGLCLSAISGCERPPERHGDALKPDERIISTPIKKPVVIPDLDAADALSRPVDSLPLSPGAPQVKDGHHPRSAPSAAITSRVPIEAAARTVNSIRQESPSSSAEASSIGQTSAVGRLSETTRSEVPARVNAEIKPVAPTDLSSKRPVPIHGPPPSLSPHGDG
jgi:hypothetical protein